MYVSVTVVAFELSVVGVEQHCFRAGKLAVSGRDVNCERGNDGERKGLVRMREKCIGSRE